MFAIAHEPIPACIDEFAVYCGGDVRCTEYAASGTPEVGVNAVKALEGRGAALIANHGLVAVGPRPGQGPAHHRPGGAHRPNRLGRTGSRWPGAHSRGREPQLRRRLQLSAREPDVAMDRVRFGHARVARVVELQFELGTSFFPRTPPSGWRDNADLLVPDFFDPDTDQWHIAIQSWVIEVDGLTVVVDTGVGNDRQRPHMPPLDHLNTGFLAALQSAGIDRNAVDVVVNTHIHSDHVGWNTMLDRTTPGCRRFPTPDMWCPPPTTTTLTRWAGGKAIAAHRRRRRPAAR